MQMRWYTHPSIWNRPLFGTSLIDDVFENFFDHSRSAAAGPRFASIERDEGLILEAQVPGMTDGDVEITAEDGFLHVAGRRAPEIPDGYRLVRRERLDVRFSRRFEIPRSFDATAAEGNLTDGVLVIRIPRRPEAQPRRIEINGD